MGDATGTVPRNAEAGARSGDSLLRLLRAIAEADRVIVRERSRSRLLEDFCRIVVEEAGFRMAWIGLLDEPTRCVLPVAVAGHDEGYVAQVRVALDGSPRGLGPTGRAIAQRRTQLCLDTETDELFAPWREAALARGYRSSGVFPLLARERPTGALSVYASEPGVFRGEVVELLEELAANLAFALDAMSADAARREAEERLRQAGAYHRTLLETSLDPLVAISPDGTITDVNRATEGATGVPRGRLLGVDFSDFFTEPDRARAGYRKVLAEGEVRDYPLTIRHVSGRTTDVLYNASVYRSESGAVQGVFAAARDVTERKRAEEALREAMRELERSNRELEQFAYVASHDLQEPLRMVASFTQLLAQRHGAKLDGEAKEFIDFAVEGARRMQRLIDDLLAYSRVGTRGGPLAPVDARAALAEALDRLAVAIAEGGAVVTSGELPVVDADPAQLAQLFQNLVGNAVKFRRPAEPPRVHVAARREGGRWLFSVSDNGIGIAPESFERIFVIFQRLHTREEYPGTGIGLAICKRIVERHGGEIRVESQPGKGSTFLFSLGARA